MNAGKLVFAQSAANNLLSLGCALWGTIDSDPWIRIVNDVGAPDMTYNYAPFGTSDHEEPQNDKNSCVL